MGMKKLIVTAVWSVAALIWAGIAIFYFAGDPDKTQWTMVVVAGAVALEVAFWTTAAVLGLTLIESRKAVFRFLTRPFRGNA